MLLMQRPQDAGLLTKRVPTPEFSARSALGQIQDRGVIRIGVLPDAPGFSELNILTGRYEGLDIAVARKLAQAVFGGTMISSNRHIEFVQVTLNGRIHRLVEHDVDMVASVFGITPSRLAHIDMSEPYFGSSLGIVVRADSELYELADVAPMSVAISPGTVEYDIYTAEPFAHKQLDSATNDETIRMVLNGSVDAGAMASVLLDKYVSQDPALRKLPVALDTMAFGLGFPQGDDERVQFFNHHLSETIKQGYVSLADLVRKRDLE